MNYHDIPEYDPQKTATQQFGMIDPLAKALVEQALSDESKIVREKAVAAKDEYQPFCGKERCAVMNVLDQPESFRFSLPGIALKCYFCRPVEPCGIILDKCGPIVQLFFN